MLPGARVGDNLIVDVGHLNFHINLPETFPAAAPALAPVKYIRSGWTDDGRGSKSFKIDRMIKELIQIVAK